MTEKPKTNADCIREMSDEELAKVLSTGTFICGRLKDVCEDMPGCEECPIGLAPGTGGGRQ